MKTMAEVLHLHGDWWWNGKVHCDGCDWSQDLKVLEAAEAFRSHQAQMLSAAGFGLVADAKAEALEEAADVADRPENQFWAEGKQRAKWLRNLAADIRSKA